MKCAIMQPTYLPWAGYFNLIASVDTFVFLDDVQFDRRSWQSRNRIFDGGKVAWLSCPIKKAPRETLIQDLSLSDDVNWQHVHAKKIQLNYANAAFFSEMGSILHALVNLHSCSLSEVNQTLIREICQRLDIHTNFVNASELKLPGQRSEHLLNICKHLTCEEYLSPLGSKDYLIQDGTFSNSGVELAFQSYEPQPYSQKHSNEFVSHLSIVDVIANIGLNQTKQYILGQSV